MPVEVATAEEVRALRQEITDLRALLTAYVTSQPEWLRTAEAVLVAGVCRETLVKYARADAPGIEQAGRITYRKDGTTCLYLKSSCISYSLRKLGQPALL